MVCNSIRSPCETETQSRGFQPIHLPDRQKGNRGLIGAGWGQLANDCFLKQERQRTGLPCVGMKGTVVSDPHSAQVVLVSWRTGRTSFRKARLRFALHFLQCFGSFVNCLWWKNSCSPAVNTNSTPQSAQFSFLLIKSIVPPGNRR
jgi:hypothetical protein